MSAEHILLAEAEAWLREHRHQLATKLEEAMSHLTDLIDNGKKLAAERTALISDRDAQRSRAEVAEKHAADLQAQIDADDAAAASAAADLDAEIAKESGVTPLSSGEPMKGAPDVVLPPPGDEKPVLGVGEASASAAPVTTTTPSGATVTVDATAGTTTHIDAVAGITTVLDHDTGVASATDATAAAVEPAPAVVAEAVQAAAAAGVTVPAQG